MTFLASRSPTTTEKKSWPLAVGCWLQAAHLHQSSSHLDIPSVLIVRSRTLLLVMGYLRREIHEEETPSEKQEANESADRSHVIFSDMTPVEEKVIENVSPKLTVSSIPSVQPEANGEHEEMKMEEKSAEELPMGLMIMRPPARATPEIVEDVAPSQTTVHQALAQMIMHQTLSPAAVAAEHFDASPAPTTTASQMGMHQTLAPAAAAAELVDASPAPSEAASQMGMHQTLSPEAEAAELVDASPAPSAAASQMGMHQTLSPEAEAAELIDASPAPSATASQMGMHQTLSPEAEAAELIDASSTPTAAPSQMTMHQTLAPEAATPKLIDEQTTAAPTTAPSEMKSDQNEASTTLPPSGVPTVTPTDATPPPSATPTVTPTDATPPPSATPTVTPTVATPPPSLAPTISTPSPSEPKNHNQEPHWTSGSAASRYSCNNTSGLIQQFTCKSAQSVQSHPIGFSLAFVVLFLLGCCTCRRACKRSRRDEQLGEYRAVADQYDDVLFEDTFDDNYSFSDGNESGGSGNMSDDGDEDDWTKGPNIELGGVHHREKDELTLEEMNG